MNPFIHLMKNLFQLRRHFSLIAIAFWFALGLSAFAQSGASAQETVGNSTSPSESPPQEAETAWSIDPQENVISGRGGIELVRASEGEYLQAQETKEGVVIFRGGIILRVQSGELHADTVKYNPGTGELYGEGGVELIDNFQIIRGEKFIYDINNSMGVLYNVEGDLKPIYYFGNILKISSPENYSAQDAFYTTCEAENPHYFLKAKKIWIQENNQIVSYRVKYYVGKTPVFWLPLHFQTELGTGIITLFGQNNFHGIFTQNSYFFGISPKQNTPAFFPSTAMLMFDYYQFQGWYTGLYASLTESNLSYEVSLGLAKYYYVDQIEKSDGTSFRSNYVLLEDGSYGYQSEYWPELNAELKATFANDLIDDRQSALFVSVEEYGNRAFRQKYKERHLPQNTPDMVWVDRRFPQTYKLDKTLSWEAAYTEDWADNHFSIYASRNKRWGAVIDGESKQAYYPQLDIAPRLEFTKNSYIIHPKGLHFQGVRNTFNLFSETSSEYKNGEEYRTSSQTNIYNELSVTFPLTNWLTIAPAGGYGIKHLFSKNETVSESVENRRNSYHYIYTLDTIRIGAPIFMTQLAYENQYAVFRGDYVDPAFGKQISHLAHFGLLIDPAHFIHAQADISRDLKTYPDSIEERFRWSPLTLETQLFIDFLHGLSSYGLYDTGGQRLGVSLNNEYSYLTAFNRAASNSFGFSFEMGGYELLFFQELWQLSMGLTWVHDFRNERLSRLNYNFAIDMNIARNWRIISDVEASSISHSPQENIYEARYDTSLGVQTPFLLDSATATLEHNLHNWSIRFTYGIQKTWVTYGGDNQNLAGFYEHTFFFSLNLGNMPGVGFPNTEIYYFNPYDEGVI